MIKAAQALEAVRIDSPNWQERVREQLDAGSNFFLILPNEPEGARRFCSVFDLEDDCVGKPMSRSDFLLMSPHMPQGTFDEVMQTWENNEIVHFIEQLDFPINKPPRLKPYLVYSPVMGILSQHEGVWEAQVALSSYRAAPGSHPPHPEAEVYQWNGSQWIMTS